KRQDPQRTHASVTIPPPCMEESSMSQTKKRAYAALTATLLAAGAITLLGGSPATAVNAGAECVNANADVNSAARGLPGKKGHDRNEISAAEAAKMNADLSSKVKAANQRGAVSTLAAG